MSGNVDGVGTNWYLDSTYNTDLNQFAGALGSYNVSKNQLQSSQASYNSAKAALISAETSVENLVASGDTTSQTYTTAIDTLKSALSNFNTAQQSYNTLLMSLCTSLAGNTTSSENITANYVDTKGNTLIEQMIQNLFNIINVSLQFPLDQQTNSYYTQLQAADSTRISARNAVSLALSNYIQTQSSLASNQASLNQANDTALILKGQYDLNPVAATQTQYQNELQTVQTLTNTVQSLQTQANTRKVALSNAFTTYNASLSNLKGILQSAYDNCTTTTSNYAQALSAAISAINTQVNTTLQNQIFADHSALTSYLASTPTDPSTLDSSLSNIQNALASTQTTARNSGFLQVGNIIIDLPTLPAAGQSLSMSDLMKFISQVSLLIKDLETQIKNSTSNFNAIRMKLWNYEANALTEQTQLEAAYYSNLEQSDVTYNTQIDAQNVQIYNQFSLQTQAINNNVNAINTIINQINGRITQQNITGQQITQDINSVAYITRDTLNNLGKLGPDASQYYDPLSQNIDMTYPGTIPNPTIVQYPTQIPLITSIPALPDTPQLTQPTATSQTNATSTLHLVLPSQSSIDAYNAMVDTINSIIAPYASQFSSIISLPLQKLYYDQYTEVRTPTTTSFTIDNTSIGFLSTIFKMLDQSSSLNDYENKSSAKLLLSLLKPVDTKNRTNLAAQGASIALANDATNTNVQGIINELQHNQDAQQALSYIKAITDQAVITGSLQAASQLSKITSGTIGGGAGLNDPAQQSQLQQQLIDILTNQGVAQSLANSSLNNELLQGAAIGIINAIPGANSLKPEDLKDLFSLLVTLQKILLILLSAIAAAGGTANVSSVLGSLLGPQNNPDQLTILLDTLAKDGVQIPPGVNASTPQLGLNLFSSIQSNLSSKEINDFQRKLDDITKQYRLNQIIVSNQQNITDSVNNSVANTSDTIKQQILEDINRAALQTIQDHYEQTIPTASTLIQQTTPQPVTLSEQDQSTILGIASQIPALQNLNNQDKVAFLTGLATGTISGTEAKAIVESLLYENALKSNPTVAEAIKQDILSRSITTSDYINAPVLPPSLKEIFRESFNKFAKDFQDSATAQKVIENFAQFTITQREFGTLAVKLLLDPARLMVRGFSIYTNDSTTRGMSGALQVPISG